MSTTPRSTLPLEVDTQHLRKRALSLAQQDTPSRRGRRHAWLVFWICASHVADCALLALFGAAGFVHPLAWMHYAAVASALLAGCLWWARHLPEDREARNLFDRTTRLLNIGLQLLFAWLAPALAFYFLGVVIIILGFAYRRPRVPWLQSTLEGMLVCSASALMVVTLGPGASPPLQHPAGTWLVAVAVALTLARASLFGYWCNELRAFAAALKDSYRALNEALELKVEDRTRELRIRNAELERANERLQRIAAAVAHDLRQPIITISAQSTLLRAKLRPPDDGLPQLGRIISSVGTMDRICNGLLRLIEVEVVDMHCEPVDVTALAQSIAGELQAGPHDPAVPVAISPGMRVRGDRMLLRVLLEALVDNALRHARDAAEPLVEIRPGCAGGEIEVRDNGRGFDPLLAPRMFEPFQQVHAERGGARPGIGLALSRAIVHRHGGTIRAAGAPGMGASFVFSLPAGGWGDGLGVAQSTTLRTHSGSGTDFCLV